MPRSPATDLPWKIERVSDDRFDVILRHRSHSHLKVPVTFTEPDRGTCDCSFANQSSTTPVRIGEICAEAQPIVRCICNGKFANAKVVASGGVLRITVAASQIHEAMKESAMTLRQVYAAA